MRKYARIPGPRILQQWPLPTVLGLNIASVIVSIAFCAFAAAPGFSEIDAFGYNRMLGRGINLGNALDAPNEGEWAVTLQSDYFQLIKDAGFDSVRIPVRWSAHVGVEAPYAIDPKFLGRVDWAIDQALSRNLAVVIDVHHYEEMNREPLQHLPRLTALWRQIALHYRDLPRSVSFELFNEPHDRMTDRVWQEIFPELLRVIRESNPDRMIIVGPAFWNSADNLPNLDLPADDPRLIVTFHYYKPFRFTHQGANWVKDSAAWKGTVWTGATTERDDLKRDFDRVAAWATRYHRPLYLGEFGAYQEADMESRARWTDAVAREAEKHGFSWSYWEFCSTFGAYDPGARAWRQPILSALTGK